MANRYIKGTFTRNAWDFYEVGCAFAFGTYYGASGTTGFVFRNNGIAQSYIDIYRAEATSAVGAQMTWAVVSPGAVYTPIEPSVYANSPIQLDLGAPPGDMSVFTSFPSPTGPIIKNRLDEVQFDSVELANSGPFLTLPPMFGLAIGFSLSATGAIAASVWYQSITDHTPPAT